MHTEGGKLNRTQLGVETPAFNPSIGKKQATSIVRGQPHLHSELQDGQCYTETMPQTQTNPRKPRNQCEGQGQQPSVICVQPGDRQTR